MHQLRLFLAVADELHFGRAAARVFITQPALSRQIRALEARLGVPLVERSSRRVRLTAAGEAVLPEARAAVRSMERLFQAADVHARDVHGRLAVGSVGAEAAMPLTRAVLGELAAAHPRIHVQLRGLGLAQHMSALTGGEVDVAFLRPPVPAGVQTLELATEPRVACLPVADPLAGRARITLAELAGYPVADMPAGVPRVWWDFWAVDPRPDGSPVRYGPVVSDMEALLLAVAQGAAMCFLPAAARGLYPRPGIAYVDVADLPPCTSALAWAAGRRSVPAIAAIRQAARSVVDRAREPRHQPGHQPRHQPGHQPGHEQRHEPGHEPGHEQRHEPGHGPFARG